MKDQRVPLQQLEHRAQVQTSQWIDEHLAIRQVQLHQTKLLRVGVEAVSLGVHRHPFRSPQPRQPFSQFLVCVDHTA